MDEYIAAILEYKQMQEQKNPGKLWDGNVPQSYSVTLGDGTTANVGTWVASRKMIRKKRLEKGVEEKSIAEKRLDEIGLLWEVYAARTRTIEVDELSLIHISEPTRH